MKIFITGIAGFIGSKVAQKMISLGHEIFGVDDFSSGLIENVPKSAYFMELDLSDINSLNKIDFNPDLIFHLAGQSSGEVSFDNPVVDLSKNTVSTLNIIQFGIKKQSKKIYYASSMSVYGDAGNLPVSENIACQPLSCYGVGKLASENYLRIFNNKIPSTIFRMFNVYGPGQNLENLRQGMVSIFVSYALKNKAIPVKGSLNRFRDFVFIDDVVDIWCDFEKTLDDNLYIINIGNGTKTTVNNLLSTIQNHIPNLCWNEIDGTPGDQFGIYCDNNLLKKIYNKNKFINLELGLSRYIEKLRN
jgi:UDP-glucose 4-epimerase